MRALGLDPDDPTKVDHEKVRVNLQYNNAKKAEAARLRSIIYIQHRRMAKNRNVLFKISRFNTSCFFASFIHFPYFLFTLLYPII